MPIVYRQEDTTQSYTVTFDSVEVQSGGMLIITSGNEDGLTLNGQLIHVHSGGHIQADRVKINVVTLQIDQAGVIEANGQVRVWASSTTRLLVALEICRGIELQSTWCWII